VPYVINAHVSGSGIIPAGGLGIFKAGDVNGLADIYVSPIQLNWVVGDHHITFAPGFTAPTGKYDVDSLLHVGRNYWTADIAGSYTWFDPKIGTDISITTGVLFNTANPATNYRTGDEFHFDGTVSQFLSQTFAVGITGYYDQQLNGDFGTVVGALVEVSNLRAVAPA